MRNLAPGLLALSALALAACGPSEQKPPAAPTAAPSAAPAPVAATSTASAAPTDDVAPPKRAKPVLRFWAFDGPDSGPAITGKRAWTAIAQGAADDRYRRVFVSVEDFVKTDGKRNTFTAPFGEIVSPVALAANLAPPAALKKGDPVLAENGNDSAFARVASLTGDTVTMSYVFGALAGELEAPRSEVLLLDGTLRMGAPVAYRTDAKWSAGRLLAKTSDDAWVTPEWVDGAPFVKVKTSDLRSIDVSRILKAGDSCLSLGPTSKNLLAPGKITGVDEDALFYDVKLDTGATFKVPFHQVSVPLK